MTEKAGPVRKAKSVDYFRRLMLDLRVPFGEILLRGLGWPAMKKGLRIRSPS